MFDICIFIYTYVYLHVQQLLNSNTKILKMKIFDSKRLVLIEF